MAKRIPDIDRAAAALFMQAVANRLAASGVPHRLLATRIACELSPDGEAVVFRIGRDKGGPMVLIADRVSAAERCGRENPTVSEAAEFVAMYLGRNKKSD